MRWTDENPFTSDSLDPATGCAAAGENQCMHTIPVDHCEFKITVIRRCRDIFPYCRLVHRFNPIGALALNRSSQLRASSSHVLWKVTRISGGN